MPSEFCATFANVALQFGTHSVFRDLSLKLQANRVIAIVGESGSGKTTLLQLVNGVCSADAGEVLVFGQPVPNTDLPKFRRRIGYAVQNAGLFPHMTVAQNISILARFERWLPEAIDVRVNVLMQFMGLDRELLTRYPYELSGGQQHRVGLCRALMLEPDLLLLDEPFSAIDAITRTEIHERFLDLRAESPISVLLVTHDLREAVKLASYIVIIRSGKVVTEGTTAAVLESESPYVQSMVKANL